MRPRTPKDAAMWRDYGIGGIRPRRSSAQINDAAMLALPLEFRTPQMARAFAAGFAFGWRCAARLSGPEGRAEATPTAERSGDHNQGDDK